MTDDPGANNEDSDDEPTTDEPTTDEPSEEAGVVVDGAWAVLLATDNEEEAVAVHRRLVAGNVDAHVRDVEESDRESDAPSIQVIVPVDDAAAAILELELHEGIGSARTDPGQVERVRNLGYEIDDLAIAELSATGGPQYALDELGDDEDIQTFLDALGAERVRFALDRAANVIVHYNDEAKVDQLIDDLCGDPELDAEPARRTRASRTRETASGTALGDLGSEPDAAGLDDVDDPMVVVVGRPPDVVGPTAAISDLDGRPAVDDVTPEHKVITGSGPPNWVYAVAVVAVVVLLILAVL